MPVNPVCPNEFARTASEVITIEFDSAVEKIAQLNPWSQELFTNKKIQRKIGNSFEEIKTFDENYFDFIIHDPPMFALAGELYSEEFYREAFRVLKKRGKMFHYIGNTESKTVSTIFQSVIRKLKEVGFQKIDVRGEAFGVVARK